MDLPSFRNGETISASRRDTFRTLTGMKRWAAKYGLEVVNDEQPGSYWDWYSVTTKHGVLSVSFWKSDGRLHDAGVHANHASHMLGSNTMSTLLAMTLTGRPVQIKKG